MIEKNRNPTDNALFSWEDDYSGNRILEFLSTHTSEVIKRIQSKKKKLIG